MKESEKGCGENGTRRRGGRMRGGESVCTEGNADEGKRLKRVGPRHLSLSEDEF